MLKLLPLLSLLCVLAFPLQARCTNFGSLASFDAKRHASVGPDFDDGNAINHLVVKTDAGLLPVSIYATPEAGRSYVRDGRGQPLPVAVFIAENACKKGSIRLFSRKVYRKLALNSPIGFDTPLESQASAAAVEALARAVLAATHCRGGEIGLNHNYIAVDRRGARPKPGVLVPAVHRLGPGYDSIWGVYLTCSLWREP
jgi:hypothetical protein